MHAALAECKLAQANNSNLCTVERVNRYAYLEQIDYTDLQSRIVELFQNKTVHRLDKNIRLADVGSTF
jgi:hypothetical protein